MHIRIIELVISCPKEEIHIKINNIDFCLKEKTQNNGKASLFRFEGDVDIPPCEYFWISHLPKYEGPMFSRKECALYFDDDVNYDHVSELLYGGVDKLSVDKLSVDKLSVDKLSVDKLSVERYPEYKSYSVYITSTSAITVFATME